MFCGTRPHNIVCRLLTAARIAIVNDVCAIGFYSVNALWGFSRPALVPTEDHTCYLENDYIGHIVIGCACVVSAVAAVAGVSFGVAFVSCPHHLPFNWQEHKTLQPYYWTMTFQAVWMWIMYLIEVFVGYTLPLQECHSDEYNAPQRRSAGIAFIRVFYTACWVFSFSTRGSIIFYIYEMVHGLWGTIGREPRIIGTPITMGTFDPNVTSVTVVQSETIPGSGTIERGRPVQDKHEDLDNLNGDSLAGPTVAIVST